MSDFTCLHVCLPFVSVFACCNFRHFTFIQVHCLRGIRKDSATQSAKDHRVMPSSTQQGNLAKREYTMIFTISILIYILIHIQYIYIRYVVVYSIRFIQHHALTLREIPSNSSCTKTLLNFFFLFVLLSCSLLVQPHKVPIASSPGSHPGIPGSARDLPCSLPWIHLSSRLLMIKQWCICRFSSNQISIYHHIIPILILENMGLHYHENFDGWLWRTINSPLIATIRSKIQGSTGAKRCHPWWTWLATCVELRFQWVFSDHLWSNLISHS